MAVIALVSCVKQKQGRPAPARDLYISQLFRGMRSYAERNADAWFILSAEHGLLSPGEVVSPYEKTLNRMAKVDRLTWAERVREQLLDRIPAKAKMLLLAGQRYGEFLLPLLARQGFEISVPLEGLKLGEQLRRLKVVA